MTQELAYADHHGSCALNCGGDLCDCKSTREVVESAIAKSKEPIVIVKSTEWNKCSPATRHALVKMFQHLGKWTDGESEENK